MNHTAVGRQLGAQAPQPEPTSDTPSEQTATTSITDDRSGSTSTSSSSTGAASSSKPMALLQGPPNGVLYEMNVLLRRPSKMSRTFRAAASAEMCSLCHDEKLRPVVSFINDKSGTKTVNALEFSAALSMHTGMRVLVIPATLNTSTATLLEMSGATGAGKNVRELSEMASKGQITDPQVLGQNVYRMPEPYHVWVVGESISNALSKKSTYSVADFEHLVRTIYPMVDVIVFDHANDDLDETSIGLQALRMSSSVVVTALRSSSISMKSFKRTYLGYCTDPFSGLTAEAVRNIEARGQRVLPGELVSTRDKLRRATLVMSGTNVFSRDEFEELIAPSTKPEHQWQRDHPLKWVGADVTIPADRYIEKDGWVCRVNKLGVRAYDAEHWKTVVILRDAAATHSLAEATMAKLRGEIKRLPPLEPDNDGAETHPDPSHESA